MIVPLLLGFGTVALTSLAFLRWGRATAAVVLLIVSAICVGLAWMLNGREGVGDFALGALLGLPALIGAARQRDRTS